MSRHCYTVMILTGLMLLTGCSKPGEQIGTESGRDYSTDDSTSYNTNDGREASAYLSQQTAALRGRQLSNVSYVLDISLNNKGDDFYGTVTVNFDLSPQQTALTVDFVGGEVSAVRANGKAIEWRYNDFFITIDEAALAAGNNTLEIDYRHPYSRTGDGLYFFLDPEDNNSYTYTNFQPFASNQLFPCFDQPDLKATYQLTARVPASWTVISNTRETAIANGDNGQRIWTFPTSERFSTYLFALHAGDYTVWEDADARIPSRIFARRAMADYVPVAEWFAITRQSFDFFEHYFDIPYPFSKYDQLMVPDFNFGAMENVGAVTFTERFLSRGQMTRSQLRSLANTTTHEMAHMWFGNLVTMRWWNGLWLNESFADYMSHLALAEATEYQEIWQEFYALRKQWGYAEDQLVTTHPIELPVADTYEATIIFDGITYAKGGSVIKQLRHLLGPENYRLGVSQYLKTHAWNNTELPDFLGALSKQSKTDLTAWSDRWLNTAGLNTIQADYHCENNTIARFAIRQTAPESLPTLREHRLQIALFSVNGDRANLDHVEAVTIDGAETAVPELIGKSCPDLVYPNYDDWAFVKVLLDNSSTEVVKTSINSVADPLLRAMLWQSLWDAVEDVTMPLQDYSAIVVNQLQQEDQLTILRAVTKRLISTVDYSYLIADSDVATDHVSSLRADIETLVLSQLQAAPAGSDMQKLWLDTYLAIASGDGSQQRLVNWLQQRTINGWMIDQDRRWFILVNLSANGYKDALVLADKERGADNSANASQSHLSVRAAWPAGDNKAGWIEELINGDKLSFAEQRKVITHLFPPRQIALKKQHYAAMINAIGQLEQKRSQSFIRNYAGYLLTGLCVPASTDLLEAQQQHYADMSPASVKGLKNALQLDQRCRAIAQLLQQKS